MRITEQRILLKSLDKIIEQNKDDILLVESLYQLGVDISPKGSESLHKYKNLLKNIRITQYPTIGPIELEGLGQFYTVDGYYNFKFSNGEVARKCEKTLNIIKHVFGCTYDSYRQTWFLKQTSTAFNIEYFKQLVGESLKNEITELKEKGKL